MAKLGNLPRTGVASAQSAQELTRIAPILRSCRNGAAPRRIKERCLHVFFLSVVLWNGCRRTEKPMIQLATPMLRSIVGWVRIHDDLSWRDIMVQMNHKLAIAKTLFPMEGWEDRLFRSKFRFAHRIARSPDGWPAKSVSWNPLTNWESNFAYKPHRKRGRPSTR